MRMHFFEIESQCFTIKCVINMVRRMYNKKEHIKLGYLPRALGQLIFDF